MKRIIKNVKNLMLRRCIQLFFLLWAATGMAQAGEAGRVVLAVGDVQIAGLRAAAGSVIHEGDELATGGDGYAYMKTIDNGFLILRPNSRARIIAYHIDTQDAANTRIKLELLDGVARSISGQAVKQARQNFRFNTPVAAIGVRGTDFTIFTDQQTTRITVAAGGIIASGFSAACDPAGSGPCEGSASRELFAGQTGKLLQINRDRALPQLLRSNGLSPDISAPPRNDEPDGKTTGAGTGKPALAVNDISLEAQKGTLPLIAHATQPAAPLPVVVEPVAAIPVVAKPAVMEPVVVEPVAAMPAVVEPVVVEPVVVESVVVEPVVAEPVAAIPVVVEPVSAIPVVVKPVVVQSVVVEPVVIPQRQIIWGRWQALLGQPGNIDIPKILNKQSTQIFAICTYFAILRSSGADLQMPSQGAMGFALTQSEAYILNETSGALAPAALENARLQIDFAQSTFDTGFDLISQQNERFPFQAQGVVAGDGTLYGNSQFVSPTNMAVSGAVSVENGGNAAYIFQGRINNQTLAPGVAAWTKN